MNDKHHIKISQFLDNELEPKDALELLQTLQQQPALLAKKNRYEAARGVLKNQDFISVSPDFAQKIQQEINRNRLYAAPKSKSKPAWFGRNLVALAATIAVVAVIMDRSSNDSLPVEISQQSSSIQTTQAIILAHAEKPQALNARINDYVEAHNNSGYANGESFAMSASFDKE